MAAARQGPSPHTPRDWVGFGGTQGLAPLFSGWKNQTNMFWKVSPPLSIPPGWG